MLMCIFAKFYKIVVKGKFILEHLHSSADFPWPCPPDGLTGSWLTVPGQGKPRARVPVWRLPLAPQLGHPPEEAVWSGKAKTCAVQGMRRVGPVSKGKRALNH